MNGEDIVCGNCGRELGATLLSKNDPSSSIVICDDCLSEMGIGKTAARACGMKRGVNPRNPLDPPRHSRN